MEYEIGNIVISKAGHDKGDVFVILKADAEYVYLMDGKYRTLKKPKKKKIKHVQGVHYIDLNLSNKSANRETIIDEDVKRAIKLYKKSI